MGARNSRQPGPGCTLPARPAREPRHIDRDFSHEEIAQLQAAVGSPEPSFTFSGDHPECAYLIFADGSLYYANNAQDEVWADAYDFVVERVLDRGTREASDFAAMSDEGKLIRHAAPNLL